VFPLLESSLPIWMADSKISSTSFQSSNARRASCFGAENPGGAFGRTVGATLSLPQLNQPTETSVRDVASDKPRIRVHFDGPSEPIVRFAIRTLKAPRFASPAHTRGCRP
jgi:hypothetical protein